MLYWSPPFNKPILKEEFFQGIEDELVLVQLF